MDTLRQPTFDEWIDSDDWRTSEAGNRYIKVRYFLATIFRKDYYITHPQFVTYCNRRGEERTYPDGSKTYSEKRYLFSVTALGRNHTYFSEPFPWRLDCEEALYEYLRERNLLTTRNSETVSNSSR